MSAIDDYIMPTCWRKVALHQSGESATRMGPRVPALRAAKSDNCNQTVRHVQDSSHSTASILIIRQTSLRAERKRLNLVRGQQYGAAVMQGTHTRRRWDAKTPFLHSTPLPNLVDASSRTGLKVMDADSR